MSTKSSADHLTIVRTPTGHQLYKAQFNTILAAWLMHWPSLKLPDSLLAKITHSAPITSTIPLIKQLSALLEQWSLTDKPIDCLVIDPLNGMTYRLATNMTFHPINTYLTQIYQQLDNVVLANTSPLVRIIRDNLLTYLAEEIKNSRSLTSQTQADFEVFALILQQLETQTPTELLTELITTNLAADIPLVEPTAAWRYLRH